MLTLVLEDFFKAFFLTDFILNKLTSLKQSMCDVKLFYVIFS